MASLTITMANAYESSKTQYLQFLGIWSDLAPNFSYDSFIKAYKYKLEEGCFPYDYL